MSIFDQYGIKEVADVTLYSIHKKQDGSGDVYYVPALYLDTLKVSSVEKTAENVWAQGGLGNSKLICWDYGKEINVTLEDALCTPASLSLCWNGILNADWKDAQLDYNTDVCCCRNPLTKLSRMEKAFYPRQNNERTPISALLPRLSDDLVDEDYDLLIKSQVVDGTKINGTGITCSHTYRWKMVVESAVKSIAVVPNRFFNVKGQPYLIDQDRKVSVSNLPDYENVKAAHIYKINPKSGLTKPDAKLIFDQGVEEDETDSTTSITTTDEENVLVSTTYKQNRAVSSLETWITKKSGETTPITLAEIFAGLTEEDEADICTADYLAIFIDNDDNYYALIGVLNETEVLDTEVNEDGNVKTETNSITDDDIVDWKKPSVDINLKQFKDLDLWLKFQSINEMIYFLLTKYENDIESIMPSDMEVVNPTAKDYAVNKTQTKVSENQDEESLRKVGKLWAYVNPLTMKPYEDDYWFHQGEPYYVKSLTIAPKGKKLKGKKIIVQADKWPGMYMFVGETYIRSRDTGEDERMQIKIPMCKIKSDHTLTLEAEGDPTTFNLELEVARPKSGIMMELTAYEVADKLLQGENGCFYAVDGSTEILSE